MSDLIRRTLAHRADHAAGLAREASPQTIAGLARKVRRRRRTAVASVVSSAVLLAVAAVSLTSLGHHVRDAAPVAPPGRDDTTVTVTSLADVPLGLSPGIGWGDKTQLHLDDGRVLGVPGARPYDFWLPFDGGFFMGSQPGALFRYDDAGGVTDTYGPGSVAVSSDGRRIAWSSEGVLRVSNPDGTRAHLTVVPDAGSVAGFLPGDAVVVNAIHPVVVANGQVTPLRGLADASASTDALGLVAGYRPGARRSGVVDSTGHLLWSTRLRLEGFSPDGRHIVGVDPSSVPRFVSVLDSGTGQVVRTVRLALTTHLLGGEAVWEDASRILIPVFDAAHQHELVLRLDYLRDGPAAVDRALPVQPITQGLYTFQVVP